MVQIHKLLAVRVAANQLQRTSFAMNLIEIWQVFGSIPQPLPLSLSTTELYLALQSQIVIDDNEEMA